MSEYKTTELEQMDEKSIQECLFSVIQENGLEDDFIQAWQNDEEDEKKIWDLEMIVQEYDYKSAINEIIEIEMKRGE
tara:strand:- start:50 stop:280 length:231 start_codon:yes stop_codon:yes gene_type:complete